jgi:hypothetical protein
MRPVVIVSDLGHFKAYAFERTDRGTPRLEVIEEFESPEAHIRVSEKLTDRAGRFGMGGERNSLKGYGDLHNFEQEEQKKVLKKIASRIEKVIEKNQPERWYLSAPKKIQKQLVELLSEETRKKLKRALAADLTKLEKTDLLERFGLN